MRFSRLAPILLSGCALGVASLNRPSVPELVDSLLATIDTARGESSISVLALAPGDELRIAVATRGCFHHFRYTLTVRPDIFGAQVRLDSVEANLASGYRLTLTRHWLDRRDLARLENLLALYRSNGNMGCTTVDSIALTTIEPGVERHESYVDGSCASYDNPMTLPISRLVSITRDRAVARRDTVW